MIAIARLFTKQKAPKESMPDVTIDILKAKKEALERQMVAIEEDLNGEPCPRCKNIKT